MLLMTILVSILVTSSRQPPWAPPTPPVWCPGPSGLCLGYINAKTIGKNPFWIILISCNIFSQWSHAFQIGPTWPYYNFYCVWCFFSGLESLSLYQMSSLDNRWRLRQVKPIGLHQLVVDWSILLLWLLAKAGEKNSTDHFYQFGYCIWTKIISHTHCTCIFR